MSDLIVPSAPALVTIPDVELCAVGTWHASTGTTTFTLQDMLDSVAALDCPGVRNPVLKLGHTEDDGAGIRWDGEPAVGWIGNMRMAADNAKIVGDFTGMPAWLAGVLPSAYPDRSVEIYRPFICQIGHVHPAAITAVALLGVSRPGVGVLRSLQDVAGLYGVEAAAKTAAQAVQQAWQDALTAVLAAWPPISAAWVASLADQIRDAVDAGDTAALAALSVDTGQGESALADATRELAATAAEQLAAEAATQGVEVEPPEQDDAHLAELATAVVLLIALGLAGAAGREALRRTAPGADGQAVADQVTTYLEGLSDSSLRTQLGGALSAAQGAGRRSVLEAAPPVRVIASEVLDQNTCSPCRDVDGTEWDNLAEALAAYPTGALYVGCLGRERCRGLLLGLWG
jgi:hypothetical protein